MASEGGSVWAHSRMTLRLRGRTRSGVDGVSFRSEGKRQRGGEEMARQCVGETGDRTFGAGLVKPRWDELVVIPTMGDWGLPEAS